MDKKDNLGKEIKSIMEEETFDMTLSQAAVDNIFRNRKKTLGQKISDFLNTEVRIPLAPAIIGFAVLFILTAIPGDVFKPQKERVIEIGSSQIIMKESDEVNRK
ncbi:MAG TPA: hypothetical protein DCM73_15135 [Clostridiales bacterium]|nr:hypothetical protein [Clostridiales bacterium]